MGGLLRFDLSGSPIEIPMARKTLLSSANLKASSSQHMIRG